MYHIKFINCAPEDRPKVPEMMKQFKERMSAEEGVEPQGLFFPRGSRYMYATVAKYKDYATWEKFWEKIRKERQGMYLSTEETDMFFEEIQL